MNPLSISARAYRSFDTLDHDFEDGCVAILGANGAGKSAYVNSIPIALFGSEGRSLANEHMEGSLDDLLLELTFEHAGEIYRIRRGFSPRGRGKSSCDFEHRLDDKHSTDSTLDWEPLTRASIAETDALIEQTIGLSRTTFLASAFLSQGQGAMFTEAPARDRKRILGEIIGLDRYDTLRECARAERRLLETRAAALTGRTQQAEEQAAALPALEREHGDLAEAETVHADNVADLERSHGELAVRYQEAREHAARRTAAEAELKTAREALEQLQRGDVAATEAGAAIAIARDELAQLPTQLGTETLEAREAELAALVTMYDSLIRDRQTAVQAAVDATARRSELAAKAQQAQLRVDQLRAQIGHLEEGSLESCPTCKQALGAEARDATIASLSAQGIAAVDETSQLLRERNAIVVPEVPAEPSPPPRAELETVRAQLAQARAAQTQRARLEERITGLQQTVDARPSQDHLQTSTEEALSKGARLDAIGLPPDVAAITAQGNLVAEQLRTARTALDQSKTQRARLDERILVARAAASQLVEAAAERKQLDDSLVVVAALERAFSPDGIPALILENSAIPYLEVEAQKILPRLGGKTAGARIELRTQRALKSGDGLSDSLDIMIITEAGGEREHRYWSGGERMRIDIALRAALAQLLANRNAHSGIFVIDEPEGLDAQGKAALVEILRDMQTRGLDRVYLISHDSDLRDSFDQTITVVAGDNGSTIEELCVFTEVAA